MDLRQRLARLDPLCRRPRSEPPARTAAAPDAPPPELGLRDERQAAGPLWSREDERAHVPRPAAPVPDLTGIIPAAAGRAAVWEDVLCLDTETTGLAGGTGTLVFLVGLGWWQEGRFRVRQLFLPGPEGEDAMLTALAELTTRFQVVVTYNGAGFDLPLLRTRALMNRRGDPCRHLEHWDLLTAARRLWGRGLPDCRQQTVEHWIGRFQRGPGDIPGALIPGVYQAFLRAGEVGQLAAVLRHNRRDIDGLGLLLQELAAAAAAIAAGPGSWAGAAPEAWSRALVCERRRQTSLAAQWAACLVTPARLTALPLAGVLDAIRLLKREGRWPQVAALIDHGLGRWPGERRLHYEAAVVYEHRLGDARRALAHAAVLGDDRRRRRLHARLARRAAAADATAGGSHRDQP
ncbi:MAG: ribonuclease H-like domain-containing protein [Candidatus Krumholzibacteria bacterium]|nr:ribonuclease H-like domain-containing protein [Candidatus Krumholzibacteria bacterium]